MASSTRPPRAGKARLLGRSGRVLAIAVLGVFFWTLPASPFLTFDDLDADREFGMADLAEADLFIDPMTTGSITNPFANQIFRGANRAGKTERYRSGPTAVEIAASFGEARLRIAELRVVPVEATAATAAPEFAVAEAAADAAPGSPRQDAVPTLALAALGGSELPASGALDVINAISGGAARDPDLPFPVAVPESLAYARENAPATEHRGTLRPALTVNAREHECMAIAVYFEARGETYRGQVAVAQVVRNRVAHSLYPNTICGVVFQNQTRRNACQFSFACDGRPEKVTEPAAWAIAEEIATKVIDGELYLAEVGSATHYHANYVYPHWAPRMTRMARIDHHIFYRFRNG